MSGKRRWRDLTEGQRRLIMTLGAVETCGKVVALVDLRHRPADQVRGSRRTWALAILVINTIGSLSYFALGRRA